MAALSITFLVKWSPADFPIFCLAFLDTERNRCGLGYDVQQLPSDSRRIAAFPSEFDVATTVVTAAPSTDNERAYRP